MPALRGAALMRALLEVPVREQDAWVDRLLGVSAELPDDVGLPSGSVPYLPCAASVILTAVREAPVTCRDVFVDLGAGLGRPAVLAHLLSGARAIGVELQPHLVARARAVAAQLGSSGVSFLEGDAASVELSEGTVFFIYSSFNGPALGRVLARLEAVAAHRQVVLCAVDFEAQEPWLIERRSSHPSLVFYDSKRQASGE
jgi:SAM-dependent methyltransferase